jgi:hypothetical protein
MDPRHRLLGQCVIRHGIRDPGAEALQRFDISHKTRSGWGPDRSRQGPRHTGSFGSKFNDLSYLRDRVPDWVLKHIWSAAHNPIHIYRHVWKDGDVALWNNLATMYRRDAFDGVLHRTQIHALDPRWAN